MWAFTPRSRICQPAKLLDIDVAQASPVLPRLLQPPALDPEVRIVVVASPRACQRSIVSAIPVLRRILEV
jgi:hypothetical protein